MFSSFIHNRIICSVDYDAFASFSGSHQSKDDEVYFHFFLSLIGLFLIGKKNTTKLVPNKQLFDNQYHKYFSLTKTSENGRKASVFGQVYFGLLRLTLFVAKISRI
ncbi:MAG: hypothetical protein EAZ32_01915 [Cytophagia bacterium]|nr:MAG: hypothetical protein EAZ46_01280 [Runella sp.]TAG23002.1 MAG: hypothetical protein EAZ38_04390 [Cytophagales bacterium]TAG42056.1 MAG: hypothetical protein EAZ32_01915 [Cytophagia bacterium]TAG83756.1 MAG: hypothetical protein EAZ22_01980 [Cytophagales bacterium]